MTARSFDFEIGATTTAVAGSSFVLSDGSGTAFPGSKTSGSREMSLAGAEDGPDTMNALVTFAARASCRCGSCTIEARQAPKSRLNCHCAKCQAFTGSEYSDVVVLPASRATIRGERSLFFRHYKKFRFPPPNLKRGRCRNCDQPFVETWGFGPIKMLFIRAASFDNPTLLPRVGAHVFYENREWDAEDNIPKYEGYLDSQRAIAKLIADSL